MLHAAHQRDEEYWGSEVPSQGFLAMASALCRLGAFSHSHFSAQVRLYGLFTRGRCSFWNPPQKTLDLAETGKFSGTTDYQKSTLYDRSTTIPQHPRGRAHAPPHGWAQGDDEVERQCGTPVRSTQYCTPLSPRDVGAQASTALDGRGPQTRRLAEMAPP